MSEMGWGYGSAGWSPRHPDDNSELQAALRPPPCPGQWAAEDFAVVRRPERRPLLIRATRLAPPRENGPLPGPAWVVKISDPERRRRPDPLVLLALFGLTRAEAGVVLEMLPLRSEDEAARHRGVAKATFRAQLMPPTASSASTAVTSSSTCWRATGPLSARSRSPGFGFAGRKV